jgi:hypothetical protein
MLETNGSKFCCQRAPSSMQSTASQRMCAFFGSIFRKSDRAMTGTRSWSFARSDDFTSHHGAAGCGANLSYRRRREARDCDVSAAYRRVDGIAS